MSKFRNIILFLLIASLCTGASHAALLNEEAETAAGQVTVTNVTVNPSVPMMDDTATITITIKNNGDTAVPISTARLYSDELRIINDKTYGAVGTLGAGNSMMLTFSITADARDGIYYLWFYLDFRDAGSLKYHIPITIESTPLLVSVIDAPEIFQTGAKQKVTVLVANPRDNELTGVNVILEGEGIQTTQSVGFVGTLPPGSSKEVLFDVTANQDTILSCIATYRNGINEHTADTKIPVRTGDGKIRAEVIVNNIELAGGTGKYTLTADVTNAGLDEAYSIVTTVSDPAVPTDPYRSYIVGSLEPDDFSSFELTFSSRVNEIPLLITYKDSYGNDYAKEVTLNLNEIMGGGQSMGAEAGGSFSGDPMSSQGGPGGSTRGGGPGMMGSFGAGMNHIPVMEIGIGIVVLILIVAGFLLFRRIRNKRKLMKRLEQHSG
ncbi:MAG: hypothetical protein JXA44_00805 [Methanospirillaceae archaeon]|nr:hypothetical protein [Methanospirillaceae archaeon]